MIDTVHPMFLRCDPYTPESVVKDLLGSALLIPQISNMHSDP